LILAGTAGGVLAGLGFGGGTLTIPLLVLLLGVGQIEAQAVNVISFLPTGAGALFVHAKNGYVKFGRVLFVVLPAVLTSVFSSLLAVNVDGTLLKKIFGGFLVSVAIVSLISRIIKNLKIGYLH